MFQPISFSHSTCLPASIAAMATSACRCNGSAMTTSSTLGSAAGHALLRRLLIRLGQLADDALKVPPADFLLLGGHIECHRNTLIGIRIHQARRRVFEPAG